MTDPSIVPTEIRMHRKSRILELVYADGERYNLAAEYLRVYSPSAEVQGHGPGQRVLQVGKEGVNIDRIEPVGNYAVCLHFDDEHNTGIYAWETLYQLGINHEQNWKQYLEELKAAGHLDDESSDDILKVVAARLLSRQPDYRCSHCGFSGQTHHWQCPSCRKWSTTKRIKGVLGE